MNNNDIFKKLRVALMLRDDQIADILQLVDFRISKGEIGNFFRNADHPKFVECGDQVLRNFLNGLVIHLRGTKENPKNPMDIIAKNKSEIANNERFPKALNTKNAPAEKASPTMPKPKSVPKKPAKSKTQPIVEKVKFNNGRNKKN